VSAPSFGPKPTSQGVRGYRNLTDAEVEWVNSIKMLEELVAERWGDVARREVNQRWMAVARTHFQEGFTALIRAITQPHDPFQVQAENNAQDFIEGAPPRS